MQRSQSQIEKVPLKMVGGNVFGRYPKISTEETYNMIVSDGALVDYAGYQALYNLVDGGQGRGAYASPVLNRIIVVITDSVYSILPGESAIFINTLNTSVGDVFISENNNKQISITDGEFIYVYYYGDNPDFLPAFRISTLDDPAPANHFTLFDPNFKNPGYITFQNGRMICASLGTQTWELSDFNDATKWPEAPQNQGELQTKPDTVMAAQRFPGRGNLLYVFGSTVTEPWTDVGAAKFPYLKSSTFNIDYGCLNAATIASNEEKIVWLGGNEQSGPILIYSSGGDFKKISTDGIDFKISNLTNPYDCYGFLFRQDGHLIYQFTFPTDNLSYIYDFNTGLFCTVTDENMNHHIAKRVVFFNGNYYFVSFTDGKFYEMSTQFTSYAYSLPGDLVLNQYEIPRIRITPPQRLASQDSFIGKSLSFTIEQGLPNSINVTAVPQPGTEALLLTQLGAVLVTESGVALQTTNGQATLNSYQSNMAVDLSQSLDGGQTFGNRVRQNMNATGYRKSKFMYRNLGRMNDASWQFRFLGFQRFVVFDGEIEVFE